MFVGKNSNIFNNFIAVNTNKIQVPTKHNFFFTPTLTPQQRPEFTLRAKICKFLIKL